MNRVVRVSIEFENGVTNWLDLDDAEDWYGARGQDNLPVKAWGGGRQTPDPHYLDNVFEVILEHMRVGKNFLIWDSPSTSPGDKTVGEARAFAVYLAVYREPHQTLYNIAQAFGFPMAADMGIHRMRTLIKEAEELRKDKKNLELLYKMLYALRDLDYPDPKPRPTIQCSRCTHPAHTGACWHDQ